MATGVLGAASSYIGSLDRPYELNAVEGFDTAATQQSGLSKISAAVLAVACALGGLALYRVISWAYAARAWLVWLRGPTAGATFERHGFGVPSQAP